MVAQRPGRAAHAVLESEGFGRSELWWREAGSGNPILLLHAWPVDGRLFDGQLRAAARGELAARVIVPDLPGFGRSAYITSLPMAYRTVDLAHLIVALIDRLGLRAPIVGGVAIGGTIAAKCVASDPDRFAGLVLVGNKPGGAPPGAAEDREAQVQRILALGSDAVADELARAAVSPTARAEVREFVRAMIAGADPRAIAALARAIAQRPDIAQLAPAGGCPVLIIAGLEDRISPPAAVRRLARLIPHAAFLEVAGAGHLVPIEAPDEVSGALEQFGRAMVHRSDRQGLA